MKTKFLFTIPALILSITVLSACGSGSGKGDDSVADQPPVAENSTAVTRGADLETDYEKLDDMLADLSRQMNQPNILKSDIERGWYLGGPNDKKYGTPEGWIFIDDDENSKWISPNAIDEESYIDLRGLCRETTGTYVASCIDSSDSDCEYTDSSYCRCPEGTKWMEDQGCILVSPKGSYIAINKEELAQGYYLGLPNQKKLNTPLSWVWVEDGKNSTWHRP